LNVEPLRSEAQHFVDCIRSGQAPVSDGLAGLRAVRVLEVLEQSLDATRWEGLAPTGALTGS
jgi:predicted dehydrogenase